MSTSLLALIMLLIRCQKADVLGPNYGGAIDEVRERALVLKQDLRIIPLSASIYLLCYLDRSNIGNAKVLNSSTHDDLLSSTNMTAYQYTIALMVFLIAYALFEVPSNYFLQKLRPSRWIAFLMSESLYLSFSDDYRR
jgi:hypothetical protein